MVQDHAYLRPEEPDRQKYQSKDDRSRYQVDGFLPTGLCDHTLEDDKLSDDLLVWVSFGSHESPSFLAEDGGAVAAQDAAEFVGEWCQVDRNQEASDPVEASDIQ